MLGSHWQEFLEEAAAGTTANTVVLDAGAGESPHRERFNGCRSYLAIDTHRMAGAQKDIARVTADIERLPFHDGTADIVLCTQTLEHTRNPSRIASEFYRVLRPGGRVFLSVPLLWPEHLQPRDYFRFTQYGIRHVMESAGFEVVSIRPMGAFFSVLRLLWDELWTGRHFPGKPPLALLMWPIGFLFRAVGRWLFAPLCYLLDQFDSDASYTLGYFCIAAKPAAASPHPLSPAAAAASRA